MHQLLRPDGAHDKPAPSISPTGESTPDIRPEKVADYLAMGRYLQARFGLDVELAHGIAPAYRAAFERGQAEGKEALLRHRPRGPLLAAM